MTIRQTLTDPRLLLSGFPLPPVSLRKLFFSRSPKKQETILKKLPRTHKISYGKTNLVIIRHPTQKDYRYLSSRYASHPVHLDDILSQVQRPKIDIEESYVFFVLHFPEFNARTNRIESNELDFFITGDDVVVIINDAYPPIEHTIGLLQKHPNQRGEYFSQGPGFLLYKTLDHLVDSIFPLIEQFEKSLETIDRKVFRDEARNVVEEISFLRRNLIFFQTIMKPQLVEFRQLENLQHPLITHELLTYFSNITDHLTKQWDRLEDAKELTDNLSTTMETYLTFKTNETIKVLTIFSVITLPFIIVSGIYGMNLSFLPIADHPMAFVITVGIMLGIAYSMLLYFKSKRWL